MRYLFFLNSALLCLFPIAVAAQSTAEDVLNSQDLAELSRFPGSGIVRYQQQADARYFLATGKVKKIDGVWRPEQGQELHGRVLSLSYRAPDHSSPKTVFKHFLSQLQQQGANALYQCKALACGPSNQWANRVFEEKRLYGPDKNQFYYAAVLADAAYAVYVIKRGNKRIYVRLDKIVSSGAGTKPLISAPDSWRSQLETSGRASLPAAELDSDAAQQALVELAAWLRAQQAKLWLVGHSYGSGPLNELQHQSQQAADAVMQGLQALGVNAEAMQAFGLGPLAPGDQAGTDRVELILSP